MAHIQMYTKYFCPYCKRAKALLKSLGLTYEEFEISFDDAKEAEMVVRSGRDTVPQIFIDGKPVGGSDELVELVESGQFFKLLNSAIGNTDLRQEAANHV